MPSQQVQNKPPKILLLNPNSSQSMTEGMTSSLLQTADLGLGLVSSTEIHSYTAPTGSGAPGSINDGADIPASTAAVLADPGLRAEEYDGILVACFSVHPLVRALQSPAPGAGAGSGSRPRAVIGIFEASILTALALLRPPPTSPAPPEGKEEEEEPEKWGIVTTGKFWESHLTAGVHAFLGTSPNTPSTTSTSPNTTNPSETSRFAGVESTGLNASDFHSDIPVSVIHAKLGEATRRLLRRGSGRGGSRGGSSVTVIIMGCAGMAGLEEIIRKAAAAEFGQEFAYEVLHVVDGVRAGVIEVEGMIKHLWLRGRRR